MDIQPRQSAYPRALAAAASPSHPWCRQWSAIRRGCAKISTPVLSAPGFSRVARSRELGETVRRDVAHQGLVASALLRVGCFLS